MNDDDPLAKSLQNRSRKTYESKSSHWSTVDQKPTLPEFCSFFIIIDQFPCNKACNVFQLLMNKDIPFLSKKSTKVKAWSKSKNNKEIVNTD